MKTQATEMHEGAEAFDRFQKAVRKIVSVPKSAIPPRPTRSKKKAAKPKG